MKEMNVEDTIGKLKTGLLASFGRRAECLVLYGSQSRGDAQPTSDVDICFFLDSVTLSDLHIVGTVIESLHSEQEINVQCTTFREMASSPFQAGFRPLPLHFEGRILHGDLCLPSPSSRDALAEAGAIAAFVMLGCRHYITGQESEEVLASNKLKNWVLKPFMWALRYEVFARTGTYPLKLDALSVSACSETAQSLVRTFQQLLSGTFNSPCIPVVETTESVATELMNEMTKQLEETR
jgi:predicted nucleotidyltransferase